MWNFFEQPWTLLGAAVLVLLGVLTFRSVWYEKRRSWQWLLPTGVALLGVGLDLGVTTDLEKVNYLLKTGIKAVEAEDCATIGGFIANDYQDSYHKSRESLLDQCRARLKPPAVKKASKVGSEVKVTPPDAKAGITLWLTFDKDSYWAQSYKPNALVTLDVYFRKQPDRTWLVNRTEVRELDKMPISWSATE